MLADQQIDRRHIGKAEEADAIELRLLVLDDRPDIAIADRIGKGAMEFVVCVRKAVGIASGFLLLSHQARG
jgi:hypothetical protein